MRWKTIKDFPKYKVSEYGHVVNTHTGYIMGEIYDKDGYTQVHLRQDGRRRLYKIHRLVAIYFIKNTDPKKICVNHINGIKTDNKSSNLEWCTHSQNMIHAYKLGLRIPNDQKKYKKRTSS